MIFGGSYGWSSAGRFHHAQSQVHRFLNTIGGYSFFKDTYSSGAARRCFRMLSAKWTTCAKNIRPGQALPSIANCSSPSAGCTKNGEVNAGGANDHAVSDWIRKLNAGGARFRNVSPVRHDIDAIGNADWIASPRKRHRVHPGALFRPDNRKTVRPRFRRQIHRRLCALLRLRPRRK